MQNSNSIASSKSLLSIQRSAGSHWVGNGFPVRTLFAYPELGPQISPFLLFDYAGPRVFDPTPQRLGVGEHPHRGFETVTIVYSGEVEHRDSAGGGGKIGSGDVQWMTAASGLVHEEFHGRNFAARGGLFEMVQLWVNLPARHKFEPPRYQGILDGQIPSVALPSGAGTLRVIAGDYAGTRGPTQTYTPMNVWDLTLDSEHPLELPLPDGWTTLLAVLAGTCTLDGAQSVGSAEVAIFERSGSSVRIESARGVRALLLAGEPIDEPIAGSGPFVMNTQLEIYQAMADYQSGKLGRLS